MQISRVGFFTVAILADAQGDGAFLQRADLKRPSSTVPSYRQHGLAGARVEAASAGTGQVTGCIPARHDGKRGDVRVAERAYRRGQCRRLQSERTADCLGER